MVMTKTGEWIPIRLNIWSDSKTIVLASAIKINRRMAFSFVHTMLAWGCEQRSPVIPTALFEGDGLKDIVAWDETIDGQVIGSIDALRVALVDSAWVIPADNGYEIEGVRAWGADRDKKKESNRDRQAKWREKHQGEGEKGDDSEGIGNEQARNALVTPLDKIRVDKITREESNSTPVSTLKDQPVQTGTGKKAAPSALSKPTRSKSTSTARITQQGQAGAVNAARSRDDRPTILRKYQDGDVNHVGLFIHLVSYLGDLEYSPTPADTGAIKAAAERGIHPAELADAYLDFANGKMGEWYQMNLDVPTVLRKLNAWRGKARRDAEYTGRSSGADHVAPRNHQNGMARSDAQEALPGGSVPGRADRDAGHSEDDGVIVKPRSTPRRARSLGSEDQGAPGATATGSGRTSDGALLDQHIPAASLDSQSILGRASGTGAWGSTEGAPGVSAF